MDNCPDFLGGTAVYVKNIIKYLKKKNIPMKICCVFPGEKNEKYSKEDVTYIGIKTALPFPLKFFEYARKVNKFLENEKFDIINSHAMAGYFMKNFKNKYNAKLINTYHGVAFYFYGVHLSGKSLVKRLGSLPFMVLGKILEAPSVAIADKIICVSERVKTELDKLYGKTKNKIVIGSGVDLSLFKKISSVNAKKILGLDIKKDHMLYVGRGGPWRKGLDRAVKLMKEIYKQNKNIHFIIIGPEDKLENRKLISEVQNFSTYIPTADRNLISNYYCASNIFFCFSRYEGGAPILTLSEAMASGCLPVCSNDANQEIIKNDFNGLIIKNFDSIDAERIISVLHNKKMRATIIKNSQKTISNFSLDKWGNRYLEILNGK
jgi:glycosyltransferase involved in cell wall biosynthesis